ncbi:hypothetical protein C1Y63_10250 [Corynebacterium sp. 13CS0277]|uniref:hypothetical protein n=1 Tax=Corynebacterium sp. 13CS0277 TaxID=2071994 RepID=UPI000D043A98|nr:hypothetical protein [Corynebacterium sp. 13CS0277]PRQ10666.1 hypothetical protein C1Y63_10250 [Corynebacterium sp. 13CS0277]
MLAPFSLGPGPHIYRFSSFAETTGFPMDVAAIDIVDAPCEFPAPPVPVVRILLPLDGAVVAAGGEEFVGAVCVPPGHAIACRGAGRVVVLSSEEDPGAGDPASEDEVDAAISSWRDMWALANAEASETLS